MSWALYAYTGSVLCEGEPKTVESLLDTLKNLGPGKLAAILATFFGLVLFFVFIIVRSSTPAYTLLYADLSSRDSAQISAKLEASGISFQLSDGGQQVSVSQKDVGTARMLLAAEGLPSHGSFGYEIFDQSQSFGTTSFQQNINKLRALEGELSRTIGTIENVRSARVHLVLPQRELFSRETREASASVFLNIQNAAAVGQEQVQAIQHLVAAAVPQLKALNVAVIDQAGTLLAKGEEDAAGGAGAGGADMKQKYELRMSRSIEEMIGRIVGYGKVRATVTADLNFDVISRNSESYDPDGQVVRSTQSITEENVDNSGASGGSVTVANNLPGLGATGAESGVAGIKNNRTEEVTNFEITKTIESLVRETGEVQKLSIAVLVDGRYETDTAAERPEDVTEDEWVPPKKYEPRTQDELDKITALVKSASGFDEDRGDTLEVINMQFADGNVFDVVIEDDTMILGFPRAEILKLVETVALSLVAVLVVLLVLRPLATHIASAATRQVEAGIAAQEEAAMLTSSMAQAQLAPPDGMSPMPGGGGGGAAADELDSMIDMSAVEGKVKASSVQKVSELVTNHPNETVSVLRQWMSQES